MPWLYRQTASSRDPDEVGKVEAPYRAQRAKVSQHESAARLSLTWRMWLLSLLSTLNFLGEGRMEPAIILE